MQRLRSGSTLQRVWIGIPTCILLALIALLVVGPSAAAERALLVRDINPGEAASLPHSFVDLNGKLVFLADDGSFGNQVWASDGTPAGTIRLSDLPSTVLEYASVQYAVAQGTAYYAFQLSGGGVEIWRSDGTRAGTRLVKAFVPSAPDTSLAVESMTAVGDTLYFVQVADTTIQREASRTLWRSDGTAGGTRRVTDLAPGQLTDVGGTLFFVATNAANGTELWKSDGTSGGTTIVADINPGRGSSNPVQLTNVHGTLFFVANGDSFADGRELWRSDGTAAGTVQVKDIFPGDASSTPTDLTAVGGSVYFTAYTPQYGRELWRSDGTDAGTLLVRDVAPGVGSSTLYALTDFDGSLFFGSLNRARYYSEFSVLLWRSDGTPAGTFALTDLEAYNLPIPTEIIDNPGARPAQFFDGPLQIVPARGGVFVRYRDILWRSDGTNKGTFAIYSISRDSYALSESLNAGENLFFANADPEHGTELWTIPVDPALYVRLLTYLPVVRDARPTPDYPPPFFPTIEP